MSKKKFFRKIIEQVPSSCQNVKSKAERRMEELKKDHFSENDNNISIVSKEQLEISKKDIEQTIFDTLEDIYEDKSPSSQILRLRSLLEYSFAFSLGYIEKFEPHTEYWPLSSLADNYCKSISNKNKYSTTATIHRLNEIIHNAYYDLKKLFKSEDERFDLLNKGRQILNDMFGRQTKPRSGIVIQPSLSDINIEQTNAVESINRVTLVNAGPGTGKTYLIVERILHSIKLIAESEKKQVVGLAFTNEAARNLACRFEYKIFGTADHKYMNMVTIKTIHSYAFITLKNYYLTIDKPFDYEIIDEVELNTIKTEFNNNIQLINEYIEENNLLTFDDIIGLFLQELDNQDKGLLSYIVNSTKEIIIDEAQDLGPRACDILYKIYNHSKDISIFAVGDQRQNIFGFNRGSLNNFYKVGFEPIVYNLNRTYRCPNKIMELANTLSFNDCENYPLINEDEEGNNINYSREINEGTESKWIIQEIKKLLEVHKKYSYKDFCILFPTTNNFNRYAKLLNECNIPFKYFGGKTELKIEIKALMYLLGSIEQKKYSLQRLYATFDLIVNTTNEDGKKLKKVTFDKYLECALKQEDTAPIARLIEKYIELYKDAATNNPHESFFPIVEIISDYIKTIDPKTDTINLFSQFISEVQNLSIDSYNLLKQYITPNTLEFEKFYTRPTAVKSIALESDSETSNYLSISTIHSAKGKEWKNVFIPGMTQGLFPRIYARLDSETVERLNSDTKLFYVACTRTKENLYISSPQAYIVYSPKGWFVKEDQDPSIFIKKWLIVKTADKL